MDRLPDRSNQGFRKFGHIHQPLLCLATVAIGLRNLSARGRREATARCCLVVVLGAIMAMLVGTSCARAQPGFSPDLVERGRYLALAGDCTACHTKPGGKAFAGGYAIQSPMGPIYSSNITPSKIAGIGHYILADFTRALRKGVIRGGAHMYPAMPYTAYQALSDGDIAALYAYFMAGVMPVDTQAAKTHLAFPFNLRISMVAWNALFLADKRFIADPAKPAAWNRGAYLVGALEHCSDCHSPRGFLMGESRSRALAGGSLGAWYAPNITSDANAGIGAWSHADLVRYLRTGATAHSQAGGGMAEAVSDSLQHLTPADLDAIATYIQTVAPVADAAQLGPRTAQGRLAHFEAALRGGPVSYHASTPPSGAMLYSGNCATCHGPTGAGSRGGTFPALYRNSATGAHRPDNLIAAVLNGVQRNAAGQRAYMPSFGAGSHVQPLDDAEIASLSAYVLTSMGDPSARVSAADVATRRAGGPTAPIVTAVRWAMPIAALVVVALFLWWMLRRRRRIRPAY